VTELTEVKKFSPAIFVPEKITAAKTLARETLVAQCSARSVEVGSWLVWYPGAMAVENPAILEYMQESHHTSAGSTNKEVFIPIIMIVICKTKMYF